MAVEGVAQIVASSQDSRWIAAGTSNGDVLVWNATTYEQVFADRTGSTIWDVDFSPDSSRLVSADTTAGTATIWDFATRQKVQTLDHGSGWVNSARYHPQGNRIATSTNECVRVWDGIDGRLLVDVKVPTSGLLWSNSYLFVETVERIVKQINAATGSTVSEWPITDHGWFMDVPQHGKFIAYSAKKTITFRDTGPHSQFIPIQHTHDIGSISFSPDGQLLAITAKSKIVLKDLSSLVSCFVLVRFASHLQSILTASQSLYIPGSRP